MKSSEELQRERITEAYLRAIRRVAAVSKASAVPIEKVREMARVFLEETPPDPAYRGWTQGGETRPDAPLGDTWYRYGVGVGGTDRVSLINRQAVPKEAADLETLMAAYGDAVEPGTMVSIRDWDGKFVICVWRKAEI